MIGGEPSTEFFKNDANKRLHGTGQGTGWSPIIWSTVCDMIITLAEKHYPGQLFVSPDGKTEAKQHAYVDDSNLSVNAEGVKWFNEENGKNWSLVKASWEALSGY